MLQYIYQLYYNNRIVSQMESIDQFECEDVFKYWGKKSIKSYSFSISSAFVNEIGLEYIARKHNLLMERINTSQNVPNCCLHQ